MSERRATGDGPARLRTTFWQLTDEELRERDAPERLQALKEERERLSGEVEAFFTSHAAEYPPGPPAQAAGQWAWPASRGWTSIPVLAGLRGRPWNNAAANFLECLRPTCVRVLKAGQGQTCDHIPWRVTVRLATDGAIERVTQEVAVGLVGFRDGQDASAYLRGQDALLSRPRDVGAYERLAKEVVKK